VISRRQLLNRSGALLASVVAARCTSRVAQPGKRFICEFTRIHENGTAPIYGIAWSPDGKFLASSSSGDSRITMWDTERRRSVWDLRKPGVSLGTRSLQFTPDGKFLIVSSVESDEQAPHGTLSLIDITTGEKAISINTPYLPGLGRRHRAASWSMSADGRYIATAIWTPGAQGGIVNIYDGRTLGYERSLPVNYYEGRRLAFDPLTNRLATQSVSYSGKRQVTIDGVQMKGIIEIWDVARAEIARTIPAHRAAVRAITYVPGTSLLASGAAAASGLGASSELINVCDSASGQRLKALRGPAVDVTDIAVSGDRALLASVGRDSTIRIWDLDSEIAVFTHQFPRHAFTHAVAFSPSKPQIAAAADNSIYVGTYTYQ
jgi:WD40 repeat protein